MLGNARYGFSFGRKNDCGVCRATCNFKKCFAFYLFIDASREFEPGKNQNILRDKDIDKIVAAYEKREDVEKFAHVASMEEIAENGFNLNIPRYVDTFEPEPEIDLNAVAKEIRGLQSEIKDIDAKLKPYFKELGLDFPFA